MNRINNKTLLIIIGVLLISNLLLIGMFLFKDKKHGRASQRQERNPVNFMARELSLNDEQAKSFSILWENTKEINRPVYDSLRIAREALYGYLRNENTDDTTIDMASGRIGNLEQRLAVNNFHHFRKLYEMCDSSQKIKLDSLIIRMNRRSPGKRTKR